MVTTFTMFTQSTLGVIRSCVFLSFQMIWFRENWYEELLRQLNEGFSLCQAAAFESRADGK